MILSMKTYVALLRAINVGGNSIIKMADLKTLFESLGFSDVVTYIQTGNVVFKSAETDRSKLAAQIEAGLESRMNYQPQAFIYTAAELKAARSASPFESNDEQQCQLMFLTTAPDPIKVEALLGMQGNEYQFAVKDQVLYYAYSRSLAGNRRNINFEKVLGVRGTGRNLKVVNKLIELAS